MTALVVPDAGELELLKKMLKSALTVDESYTLKLFKNNVTPTQATVAGDFTEADFTGYAAKTLTRAGWNDPTTVSNKGRADYSVEQIWTCTGGSNTIYGYYIIGTTSGVCLWAQLFASPRTVDNGVVVSVTPSLTLNSEN